MNDNTHTLYGAGFSLYSGKARSYLRYKNIPFDEVLSSLRVYKNIIIPNTGVRFVPVVKTPGGEYLQDTSHIIDSLEESFPERSVIPETPRQRLASFLFELYGDEWLLIPAMHYRWNYDNFPFIFDEFGRTIFPGLPRFLQRAMGKRVAARFRGFLPTLGISDSNRGAIEDWYERDFLKSLNDHFSHYDFLFGGRPSIGDFGLFGPLYAHLSRDPYPGRLMQEIAPAVSTWVNRMQQTGETVGDWLPDDEVPDTLKPILQRMFKEHWPVLTDTALRLQAWYANSDNPAVPRWIGKHSFVIGDVSETRAVLPYCVWKMQRSLDCYRGMTHQDQRDTDDFLQTVDGHAALQFDIPLRLTRIENRLSVLVD